MCVQSPYHPSVNLPVALGREDLRLPVYWCVHATQRDVHIISLLLLGELKSHGDGVVLQVHGQVHVKLIFALFRAVFANIFSFFSLPEKEQRKGT